MVLPTKGGSGPLITAVLIVSTVNVPGCPGGAVIVTIVVLVHELSLVFVPVSLGTVDATAPM